jgi:hypothetical protein
MAALTAAEMDAVVDVPFRAEAQADIDAIMAIFRTMLFGEQAAAATLVRSESPGGRQPPRRWRHLA